MATYIVCHRHEPGECGVAFAAWRGFDSPLRRRHALGSCGAGGHAVWWTIEAEGEDEALGQIPPFVAERSQVERVAPVAIP